MTQIWVDMDGTIVDFDLGFLMLVGRKTKSMHRAEMWGNVIRIPNYYRRLPPMQDYLTLWNSISHLDPKILTAVPRKATVPTARQDKIDWINYWIGPQVPVSFGPYAHEKKFHCTPGDVLIDDRPENIKDWNEVGGIGILHTSAKDTIRQLQQFNLIQPVF